MGVKKVAIALAVLALAGCSTQNDAQLITFDRVELGSNPAQTTESAAPDVSGFVVDSAAEVDIEDQQGDGDSVSIDELRVGRAGTFLVIYNSNGLVLATQMVSPLSQPVNIALDVELETSADLQAVLYLDNGDSIFDLRTDTPIVDGDGELVHEDFYYRVVEDD